MVKILVHAKIWDRIDILVLAEEIIVVSVLDYFH